MNTHTVEISQLYEKAGTSIEISSASRAADTASLSFRLDSVDDAAPFAFGDEVTLTENGIVVFHGYVTEEPNISIDAKGMACDVTLANIVALLDATPYTEPQSFKGTVQNESRLVDVSAAISKILQVGMVAPGGGEVSDKARVDFSNVIMCPTGSGSQTCWSLINSCLHWVPNAVTWYDPTESLLSFRAAENGTPLTLDLNAGELTKNGKVLFTFAGYESAAFKARHDLTPPAVGLYWEDNGKQSVWGGNVRQPWAFVYQIPGKAGHPATAQMTPKEARRTQQAAQTYMTVLGSEVPTGWALDGNMKKPGSGAPGKWHKFWSGFSAFSPLAKTSVACLAFGQAIFEPDSAEDAFPPGELAEDNETPENYEMFNNPQKKIYSLYQGQFPASSKKRDNVNGLRFCKGRLRQYVWLVSKYSGQLTEEQYLDFFSGSASYAHGDTKKNTRYALLELENIFINRRRKKYQVGTNKLDATDEDYLPDSPDDGGMPDDGNEATDSDYSAAASAYYQATRKLYYDGSISLRGVNGYNPSQLAGANLNIVGARDEWNDMKTPVVRADWNPQFGTLTISTGSPEILTIDERIQRTLIGRQSNFGAGTSFANPELPSTPTTPDDEEEETEEDKAFPMVAPSISARTVATKTGRPLNPFEMYKDDNSWYINEGILTAPGGRIIQFETTDVTALVAQFPNDKFTVRAEREPGTTNWKAFIRHYTPRFSTPQPSA